MTDPSTFNQFDLGVLGVLGISALLSFFRGFVRELLSLGSWLGAVIITLYAFQPASKYLEPHVGGTAVANGLASMGVFFLALLVLSLICGLLLKFLKSGNEVGVLDNLMGLLFGVARGVLVVAIGYFVTTIIIPEKELPDYVHKAKTKPFVARAAKWVGHITPDYLDTIAKKDIHSKDDADEEGLDKDNGLKILNTKWREHNLGNTTTGEDEPTLPSMEDLQERIRKENEKR